MVNFKNIKTKMLRSYKYKNQNEYFKKTRIKMNQTKKNGENVVFKQIL